MRETGPPRSNFRGPVLGALATTAWGRPRVLLLGTAGLAVVLGAIAYAAAPGLGLGSSRLGEEREPDIVVAAEPRGKVTPQVQAVALETIAANVAADPAVASLAATDRRGARAWLEVEVGGDEADERAALERLREDIDPGPMRVHVGGETAELQEAARSAGADLWRLELLVVPLVVAVLVGLLGWRFVLAPILSALVAATGTLASLGLLGVIADPLLPAAVPALVVAVVLGIELSALLSMRLEDGVDPASAPEGLDRALAEEAAPLGLAAAAAVLAGSGLLATSLDLAGWIALAVGLAGVWAWAGAMLATTSAFALTRRRQDGPEGARERWPVPPIAASARTLARGFWRTAAATLLVVGALAALSFWSSGLGSLGHTLPLEAVDLDRASEPARAAAIAGPLSLAGHEADLAVDTQLVGDMPLVAALAGGLLAAAFGLRFGARAVPFAVAALLPAGAAAGILFVVFEDGTLAAELGQEPQGSVNVLALAFAVASLAAIAAARTASALETVRAERELDPGPPGIAERAAGLTLPGALTATVVVGALAGVLAGADLYPARELGLAVAAGLLLDLVLLRPVVLAAAARWGAAGPGERSRIRLPRWPARLRFRRRSTPSAS
jgi:hypothetical protein